VMVGSRVIGDSNCHFSVWSPLSKDVSLRIVYPEERIIPMDLDDKGYWQTDTDEFGPGTRYFYRLDGTKDRPDPASKFQPEGVHGPSQVIDHNFN
jgi:maltooligosyltrehalose trehalohydrolase